MLLLVTWLFVVTQRAVKLERQTIGVAGQTLWKERCTYAVITTFFALSYIGRFIINEYDTCGENMDRSFFFLEMTLNIVYLFEGVSMGVLMAFHFFNFKTSRSILSLKGQEPYASIMPSEYNFLSDS